MFPIVAFKALSDCFLSFRAVTARLLKTYRPRSSSNIPSRSLQLIPRPYPTHLGVSFESHRTVCTSQLGLHSFKEMCCSGFFFLGGGVLIRVLVGALRIFVAACEFLVVTCRI